MDTWIQGGVYNPGNGDIIARDRRRLYIKQSDGPFSPMEVTGDESWTGPISTIILHFVHPDGRAGTLTVADADAVLCYNQSGPFQCQVTALTAEVRRGLRAA